MALFKSYCRGLDIDPDSYGGQQRKNRALRELKTGKADTSPEITPEVLERMARFAKAGYAWRKVGRLPAMIEVLSAFPEWEKAGRPDTTEDALAPNMRPFKTQADHNAPTGELVL